MPRVAKIERWIVRIGKKNYFHTWGKCAPAGVPPIIDSKIDKALTMSKDLAEEVAQTIRGRGNIVKVEPAPLVKRPKVDNNDKLLVNGDCTIHNPEGLKVPTFEERYSDNFPNPPSPDPALPPSECSDCNRWEERFWKLMDILEHSQERTHRLLDKLEALQNERT